MGELFKLFVKVTLDETEFDEGIKNTEKKAGGFGEKLKSGLGKAVGFVSKAVVAAIGAAATGLSFIVKSAVGSYSEYEQLVGGVRKLYGNMGLSVEEYAAQVGKSVDEVSDEWGRLEEAQNLVLKNAQEAYKTAGMSANDYMQAATSFSASLINSLGGDTVKAAEQTEVAMRAMADNVNTFGTDMSAVQGAFQGFAKQNYTMLDNLKLGYGGTKTEMERLIKDAEAMKTGFKAQRDEAGNLTMAFSDIITAIDLIQQKQNIAGTTAREAATTIQGSVSMAKAAWQNLLTAFGSGEGVEESISAFVDSAKTVIVNTLPVIKQALKGVGKLVEELGPIITAELPGLVKDLLPSLLSAATSLVASLVKALPGILSGLWGVFKSAIHELQMWLTRNFPEAGKVFHKFRDTVAEAFEKIKEYWENILKPALEKIGATAKEKILPPIQSLLTYIQDNVIPIIAAVIDFIMTNVVPVLVPIIELIIAHIGNIITVSQNVLETVISVINGIIAVGSEIFSWLSAVIGSVVDFVNNFEGHFTNLRDSIGDTVESMKKNVVEKWENLKTTVIGKIESLKLSVTNKFEGIKNTIKAKIDGARDAVKQAIDKIKGFFNFEWSLPKIKLPHFSVSGSANPIDWLKNGVPKISVDWYAKGGIFTNPSIIGVGEAGAEAVVPLSGKYLEPFAKAVAEQMSGRSFVQNITINSPTQLDPSEVARQTRNSTRNMIMRMRTT